MKYIIDDENYIISPINPLDKINVVDLYEFLKRAFPNSIEKFSIVMGDGTKQENQFFQNHTIAEKQLNTPYSTGTPREFLVTERSSDIRGNNVPGSTMSPFKEDGEVVPEFPVFVNDVNTVTPDNIHYSEG